MEKIRIQKLLSDCGFCSRRKAEALISAGRVKVNGHPVRLGDKALPTELITVDGERVTVPKRKEFRYIMLNKPRGYVTTMSDEQGRRCVTDLLEGIEERVYPIGRLDRNSEGLLLLTNDGAFANGIMHPSRE
ncbi:MAG: rRNA pseudouridine synthase, partial [Oscillospiraceae bacterium]|nr:rRNA pseudouridine synthase [Oscillospiraceae bacterium]